MNALKYIGIFSICLLTACAHHKKMQEQLPFDKNNPQASTEQLPTPNAKSDTYKANTSAAKVSSWEISGAMGARNNRKGWSASLNWIQQGLNNYQIRLYGPLGGGTILITKKAGIISYTDGPKKVTSKNADALLMQQTGIRLPVNNLYYWVRGLPAPGAVQSSQTDKNHNLVSLNQAGYSIRFSNYTTVNSVSLPGKIQLQGNGATIKLVIKRWKI